MLSKSCSWSRASGQLRPTLVNVFHPWADMWARLGQHVKMSERWRSLVDICPALAEISQQLPNDSHKQRNSLGGARLPEQLSSNSLHCSMSVAAKSSFRGPGLPENWLTSG